MTVTAVIVAAGRGTRLRAPSKPLAVVGGVTLLDRALATARAAGIARRVVVVASLDGPVAAFCRRHHPDVEVVPAPDHARGNGATVVAGLAHAGGRCLVMMVDHLHEVATLRRMLETDGELVLAIDSRAAYVDPEDATLARRQNGQVTAIGKHLARFDAIEAGLAAGRGIGAVEIDGAFWTDIDTPRERRRAIGVLVDRYGAKSTDGPVARTLNRPLSKRVSRRLLATGIGPNPVTLSNLALLVLSGVLLALGGHHDGLLIAGGVLAQVASALDGVDGELARVSGRSSAYGAVLDAVCDRYGDLAVLAGAAVAAGTGTWPWAMAALVANWQLSFLRREHQRIAGSLPESHVRWQWSRDVRILALAVSCVLLHPLWGLVAWGLLGNADALRRLIALLRLARKDGAPPPS